VSILGIRCVSLGKEFYKKGNTQGNKSGVMRELTGADDNGLSVREDGGDGEAAGALDIHEEGARGRDESLCFVCITTC